MNAPVFLQRKVTFTQRHNRKCYNIDFLLFAKEIKIIRLNHRQINPLVFQVFLLREVNCYPRRHAFSFRTALWKLFCFQRFLQYSNLFTYSGLKWNKRWIWRYSLHVGFRFGMFPQPQFPGSCATLVRRSLHSKTLQRLITGKLSEVDPCRPQNLQRREFELTRWPK